MTRASRSRTPPWPTGTGRFPSTTWPAPSKATTFRPGTTGSAPSRGTTILSHADKISDIADRLVTAQVPCLTFESLCRKHGVDRLDVLLIDAEGYDWEIVRRLDLEARHPRVLVYEHYHLPAPVRAEARAHLEARGYRTVEEGFDTWCLSERAGGRLSPVWEGLEPVDPPFSADEHPA